MMTSVVGLLLLKYYKGLRAILFYSALGNNEIEEATHIYIRGSDKNESICSISSTNFEGRVRRVFHFKHLRYEYYNR